MKKVRSLINRRRSRRKRAYTGVRLAVRRIILLLVVLAGIIAMLGCVGAGAAISLYGYYAQKLPEPGAIQIVENDFQTTRLYDRTGKVLLYEVIDPLGGDRKWVELQQIPTTLRDATIAIEDKSFYENQGYDLQGIARAFWNNLTGGVVQGGSSITQQLVKNVLIDPQARTELSLDRKFKELILAIRISNEYSKDQVLTWYLNTNFYGNLAYGVEAASEVYFGKPVTELTLAESAMLAAIPQSPALNPIDNFDLARERQRIVLTLMVEQGYITSEQADVAYATPLEIKPLEQRFNLLAPHFAVAARKQLEELFGPDVVYRGGLVVYTTLDYPLYLQAQCAARSHIARLSGQPPDTIINAIDGSPCDAAGYLPVLQPADSYQDHHVHNAAITILKAPSAEVLVMLGSLDYLDSSINGNFNVALAERQPGSAMKPFTYITAFQQGYSPATMTLDVRTAFENGSNQPYVPENADRSFHGPQSIRSALANSYNVPAVQVLSWVGIDNVIRTAHAMGINTLDRGADQYGLALTLGGGEVTLYDITYAYSVLANGGIMRGRPAPLESRRPGFRTLDPTFLLRVEDRSGKILWEYGKGNTFGKATVVEPSLAYLVNDILSDEISRRPSIGAGSPLLLSRPSAVKTGTTNNFVDNWTIGYTPQIVTGVWVGNSDNSPMQDLPAITGAAPIWHAIMEYALRDYPVETWSRPADIVELTVCDISGLLPTPYCPTHLEIFRRGTEPTHYDTIYQPFKVNRETGLLATVYTPIPLIEDRIYMILPPEASDWVTQAGIPQPPTAYDTIASPLVYGDVAITDPAPFSYVRGTVSLQGNARDSNFLSYRLDYGKGLNPESWTQIGEDHPGPVYSGELGIWDTSGLDGLYSIRLTVLQGGNAIREFIIQVTVDNSPPQIQLLGLLDGQQFHMSDEFIVMQPLVNDNISMDRVEFYVDDRLVATSTIAPFNERWIIATSGRHTIQLRAYDSAGNTAVSNRITIEVLP
jgi:membrane peptidoglycan carboxypeptidase